MNELNALIEVSRFYGNDPKYVIAGGGNTSFKNDEKIWIKASGIPLSGIGEEGFVCLSRHALGIIETSTYSEDPIVREEEVKADMKKAVLSPANLRPSVETSLHNLIDFTYVVHTHPTLVNGLMCSNQAKEEVESLFGTKALYVEYTDPGFILFKKVQDRIKSYVKIHLQTPKIIFLQNHGVFVGADSIAEIRELYTHIESVILKNLEIQLPSSETEDYLSPASEVINETFAARGLNVLSVRCPLTDYFSESPSRYLKISKPFNPDIIVYCKSRYLFLPKGMEGAQIQKELEEFERESGYYPKVLIEEQGGLIAVEETVQSCRTVIEVYLDLMKISFLSEGFGGPHFMTPEQIKFIDNWEVEHYRRKVAKGSIQ